MEIPTKRRALDTCHAQRVQRHVTILKRAQLHSLPSSLQKAQLKERRTCNFNSNMGFDYYIELDILHY